MLIAPLIYKWRDWLHKKCINIQWQHIALLIKINTFPLGNRNHLRAVFDSCGWQLCRKGLNKQTNEQTKPPNQPKQHNFLEWGWKSGKKSRSGTQKLFTGSSLLNRARWGDSLLHPTNSTSPILIFFFFTSSVSNFCPSHSWSNYLSFIHSLILSIYSVPSTRLNTCL